MRKNELKMAPTINFYANFTAHRALGDVIARAGEDILSTFVRIERSDAYRRDENGTSEATVRSGCYKFIPKEGLCGHLYQFLALKELIEAERLFEQNAKYQKADKPTYIEYSNCRKINFVDAGCGIGNIMLIARIAGMVANGIEYDPKLVRRAKKIHQYFYGYNSCGKGKVIQGDILKHRSWKNYDIVYFYCPMCNSKMEKKFEEKMEDEIKVGTFIVPHLKASSRFREDPRFARVALFDNNGFGISNGGILRKVSQ